MVLYITYSKKKYSNRKLFARLSINYHDVHVCLVTIIVIKSKQKCLIIRHIMIKLKIINNINQKIKQTVYCSYIWKAFTMKGQMSCTSLKRKIKCQLRVE